MKYPNIAIIYDRKGLSSKSKEGIVEVRVTFNRQQKYYSTGVKVLPNNWDREQHVVRHKDQLLLNSKIDAIHNTIKDFITLLATKRQDFSFTSLASYIDRSKLGDSFIDFIESYRKERADITESTRKNQKRLTTFLENCFPDISTFADLTRANIVKFDNELHKAGYKQTTIYTYHKFMKLFIAEAIKREYIEKDPYLTLRIDKGKSQERRYLTEIELNAIRNADTSSPSIQRVKDLFLFQCITGLAYAELESFDFNNLEEREGKFVLRGRRKKTEESYYIVLLPEAIEILRKYDNKLPLMTNQKYNQFLKLLAGIAGIKKNLTSHMARHTFAVNVLNSGIPIETLSKMLGHTDIKTTKLYARIIDHTVEEAFDKLSTSIK